MSGEPVPDTALQNINALRNYWLNGEGAVKIRWGTKGDLTRCHRLVFRAADGRLSSNDAWGFCNNLHKIKFGRPNPRD